MTCETAAKLRGGFRVITNEKFDASRDDTPKAELSVVDDSVSDEAAHTFLTWLESEYHANKTPFQFDDTVVVEVVDLPEHGIVGRTVTMMKAKGWSIDVNEHKSAGCRAASVTLCPPRSAARKG